MDFRIADIVDPPGSVVVNMQGRLPVENLEVPGLRLARVSRTPGGAVVVWLGWFE